MSSQKETAALMTELTEIMNKGLFFPKVPAGEENRVITRITSKS